jgi:hypothetical protein
MDECVAFVKVDTGGGLRDYPIGFMDRLAPGHVVDATYRVESVLAESDRALVYVVSHVRFPEVPLVMKVAPVARAADFERDTAALANLSSPNIIRLRDHYRLPDGRPYRVVERLAGPTLREALMSSTFNEDRTMEIMVALSAAVHEAQVNNVGPCDLTVDNLMFADGRAGRLCLMRVLVPDAEGADQTADQNALVALRVMLERGLSPGRRGIITSPWKPPSNIEELRKAMVEARLAPRTPDTSAPGANIQRWEVVRKISETLRATVYEAKSTGGQHGILKIAGPEMDLAFFKKHTELLGKVQSRHVVRALDTGAHEGTPFVVMEPLRLAQNVRLKQGALTIDAALQAVDELLWGADAIRREGGAPSDFSLEHCYQGTPEGSPAVLTHGMSQLRTFGVYGRPSETEHADAWSAVVALYELITGRLPFPTTKHSLAKAWMGMAIPLVSRRRDVPLEVSELVGAVLGGKRMTIADIRRELTRIRSTPAANRPATEPPVPDRRDVTPLATSIVPPLPSISPGGRLVRDYADTPVLGTFHNDIVTAPTALEILSRPAFGGSATTTDKSFVITPRRSIEPPPPAPTALGTESIREGDLGIPGEPGMKEWRLDLAPARCPLTALHAAAFGPDGQEIVAVARDALARFRGGQWTVEPVPPEDGSRVLSLTAMGHRTYLATTSSGPLLRLGETGGFVPWGVALDRYCFYAAIPDGDGFMLVGGTQNRQHGAIATLVGQSLTIVAAALPSKPLRFAARLPDGTVVAVTEGGSILRVRDSVIVESIQSCEVDLLGVRIVGEEIVVVGAGAWAFRVTTSPLRTHLEPVETTSSLRCLTSDGTHAWTGSSKGRILRRSNGQWHRMNRALEGDPAVLALDASNVRMRALMADGQLVVGRPL